MTTCARPEFFTRMRHPTRGRGHGSGDPGALLRQPAIGARAVAQRSVSTRGRCCASSAATTPRLARRPALQSVSTGCDGSACSAAGAGARNWSEPGSPTSRTRLASASVTPRSATVRAVPGGEDDVAGFRAGAQSRHAAGYLGLDVLDRPEFTGARPGRAASRRAAGRPAMPRVRCRKAWGTVRSTRPCAIRDR